MADSNGSPNAFADALDQMVRGARLAADGEPLSQFAHRLQAAATVPLEPALRAAVWARLMEDRPAPADRAASGPPVAGGVAGTLPPLVARPESTRSRRPDPRNVHVIPAGGGWIVMALLIVVVALAAAMFANLGDDDPGFVPAVSATELAPASPVASPQASPPDVSGSDVTPRGMGSGLGRTTLRCAPGSARTARGACVRADLPPSQTTPGHHAGRR